MKPNTSIFFLQKQQIAVLLLLLLSVTGCKKLVEVETPETNPTSASTYTNDATAASVLTSIYAKMSVSSFAQGINSITLFTGLNADELQTPANIPTPAIQNAYKNQPGLTLPQIWRELYANNYIANAALEGIAKSTTGMSDSVKNQLTGEAKFMRAFLHFYAVNLFGDVPYITSTDPLLNAVASRAPKQQVYDNIVADLKDAQTLLKDNYVTPTGGTPTNTANSFATDRTRPNKWTATAMLARVYLYMGRWSDAETEASKVIANTGKFILTTDITKVFLRDSKEIIWSIQPTKIGSGTAEAVTLNITSITPNNPAYLQKDFQNIFEAGDRRRINWIDSPVIAATKYYVPGKYKVKAVTQAGSSVTLSTEYLVVFRLAEQYLIRAEARAKQDKIADAKLDLTAVRTRAGLGATTANDQPTLLQAIEKERRVELFVEWGHRWLDLKRTSRIDAVMSVATPQKVTGITWDTNMQLWPIPSNEILLNPNLAPQNPGYN